MALWSGTSLSQSLVYTGNLPLLMNPWPVHLYSSKYFSNLTSDLWRGERNLPKADRLHWASKDIFKSRGKGQLPEIREGMGSGGRNWRKSY